MRKHKKALSFSVLLLCLLCASSISSFASHLRGTSVSWQPTATPGTVQFTIQYSQRASSGCTGGTCAIGGTVSVPFDYGDGQTTSVVATVTSLNSAEDYISAIATFAHTYASSGPFIAAYQSSARVSTIKSGAGTTIRMETSVSPFANPVNHPPVVSMPAIITVPLQATTGFTVNAADQDHDTLQFRLATSQEMYAVSPFSCAMEQPPGLSIANSGAVTWDTTQITSSSCGFSAPVSGDLWAVQFMVEDLDSNNNVKSKTPLDVILKFVTSTEAPPTMTFSNPGPITVAPGTPITFTVSSNDATVNSRVTLNATGLPIGAAASNTNQALIPPVSSTFSWTPTLSQAGTYVVTYTATNDTMEQVLGSVSISVLSILPPSLTCSAAVTAQYNQSVSVPLQFTDPQGDAVTVVWSVDGTPARTDSVPASTSPSNLTLSQTFTTLGAHTVDVTATNSDGVAATCSTPVTVNKADQTISFGSLPNVTYGDPDAALLATATSGAVVSFTATGSCSIVNGQLHLTSAGACNVTANQAGDANYNAAPPITQQLTVAPKALSVTATDATRTYGLSNPALTGTIVGTVNGDALTASYSTAATQSSLVGTYPIIPALSGGALSNYTVTLHNGTLTITPGAPAQVITTVPPATLTAGGNVGTLTATIEDSGGNTVTSSTAIVSATVLGPNGYSQTVTGTAVHGVATLNLSSLPLNTAGTYSVATASAGLTGSTSIVTVNPGPSSQLSLGTLPGGLLSGQNLGTISATVQDTHGNIVPNASAPITVTITGPNGYSQTLTVNAVNGIASLNLSSLTLRTAGTYSITVSSNGLTSATGTFVVSPAGASQLANSTVPPSITSGSNLGTLTATVQDLNGNTVTSSTATVTATINGPNGYSQTLTTNAVNGIASLNLSSLGLREAGTYTVTTSSNGLSRAVSTVNVTPGAAAQLVNAGVPASITTDGSLGTMTATVQDTNGNTVLSSNAPVTVTITGPGGYAQTLMGAAVNGVASVDLSGLKLTTTGTYVIATSSNGMTTATSSVNVAAGAATSILLGTAPTSLTSGQGLGTLSASIRDAHGNVVTTSSAQVTATLTGPNGYSQTVSGTVVNGVLTLDLSSLNPTAAGTYTLTLSGAGLTGATSTLNIGFASQSISLPNLPNTTYGASSTSLPANSSAGLPVSYTVTGPAVVQGSSLMITGAGAVTVTATQAGDTAHSPVTVTKSFAVAQAASVAVLSPSTPVSVLGSSITLSAQITSPAGAPTGTVTFLNGSTVIGQAAVTSTGGASFTTSSLPMGAFNLTASYSGDANFLSSLSPSVPTSVQDFGLTALSHTAAPVIPGNAASFNLALTPQSTGFSSAITLTATGLPPGATYSFSPTQLTPGSAVANSVLTVQTPRPIAAVRNLGGFTVISAALLILPFGSSRKLRRKLQNVRVLSLLAALALFGGVAGLTGCGANNGFLGQAEKSYTVTVTATSGNLVHTTTVVVDVQ